MRIRRRRPRTSHRRKQRRRHLERSMDEAKEKACCQKAQEAKEKVQQGQRGRGSQRQRPIRQSIGTAELGKGDSEGKRNTNLQKPKQRRPWRLPSRNRRRCSNYTKMRSSN
ncbi:hypothetical protein Acr_24g0000150 [Actinidia rufa]|uniref:Uncharacterized protein n=1 Tax=Actinidia rufa TaxID=165716 RepID=A0A7J0GSK5_9ERIC|nr:hypothetical protein Acr_24g0000150 [Actinidia rufa]